MKFKLSKYLEIIENSGFNRGKSFLYSLTTGSHVQLSQEEIAMLQNSSFQSFKETALSQLVTNSILVPDFVNETKIHIEELLAYEKITIVISSSQDCSDISDLIIFLNRHSIEKVCLMVIYKASDTSLDRTNSLRCLENFFNHDSEINAELSFLILESFDDSNYPFKITIKKPAFGNNGLESLIYTHIFLNNKKQLKQLDKVEGKFGISLNFPNSNKKSSFQLYSSNCVGYKRLSQVNIINSKFKLFKELPISGIVVDYNALYALQGFKYHSKCKGCKYLVSCGGYSNKQNPVCPTYVRNSDSIEFQIALRKGKSQYSTLKFGIGNKLVLNDNIQAAFTQMLIANSDIANRLKISYVQSKYYRGFSLTQDKQLRKASVLFSTADYFTTKMFNVNSFEYKYIQTFSTSTTSYLKFKKKEKERAVSITQRGIDYGILLQEYDSSEIMCLFIAQMLMNLSKIYLVSKEYMLWRRLSLENIHMLLNYTIPRSCRNLDKSSLSNVPTELRYFILMEAILKDILTTISKSKISEGFDLISSINVQDKSKPVNRQLISWVNLNSALNNKKIDEEEFEIEYSNFMNSCNETYNFRDFKFFIRNRIRKERKQLYVKLRQNNKSKRIINFS